MSHQIKQSSMHEVKAVLNTSRCVGLLTSSLTQLVSYPVHKIKS